MEPIGETPRMIEDPGRLVPMREPRQPLRITIRLTPYQARRLWDLRTAGLPEGARPRTATEVLLNALLEAAERTDRPRRA
jgi:hypothetical protein